MNGWAHAQNTWHCSPPLARETGCRWRQLRLTLPFSYIREFSLHLDLNFPQREEEIGVRAVRGLGEGMSVAGSLCLATSRQDAVRTCFIWSSEWGVPSLAGAGGWGGA